MPPEPQVDIDVTRPSPARVYDYLLGGTDNYAVDRKAAEAVLTVSPQMRDVAVENRAFLIRAVDQLAGDGIRQFLDLGSGLPTQENTHQVAQRHTPDAHVVYVDRDPTVLAHSRALLGDQSTTVYVQADVRNVDAVLADPGLQGLLDFSQPIGLLAVAVFHFIGDEDDPAGLIARYASALSPGSQVVIACGSSEDLDPVVAEQIRMHFTNVPAPLYIRSQPEIAAMFGDLEVRPPGVVPARDWPTPGQGPQRPMTTIGGVAGVP